MQPGASGTARPAEAVREQPSRRRPSAEDIAWVGLGPMTLVLIGCLLWLAPSLSDLYPRPTYPLFSEWQVAVDPEYLETTRFLFALVAPFAFAGLVLLGSAKPADRRFDSAVIALQIAGFGLIVWGVLEQERGSYFIVPPDYFEPLLLSVPVLIGGLAVGVALTVAALAGWRPFDRLDIPAREPRRWTRAAIAAALVLTALWLLPAVVTDGTIAASGGIPAEHIPLQAQDYFAVVNGRTPFVDYVPQYVHLLPLVFAPVLTAFGLSLSSFSVLMTALSLVALLALYAALRLVTQRSLAALALYVPVLAISLFPWSEVGIQREFNGNYYAFFPGRYLGPFVVAWLVALAVRRRRLPVWLLFFVAGLVALNNAEFGVPCVVAMAVALVLGSDRRRPLRRSLRARLPQAVIGLLAAAASITVVTLARAGELPNPESLTYYSSLFARQGFGLVPMPTLGLHIAIYLTFVAALLAAAVRYVQGRHDSTLTAMLAYFGVFGLLTSSYFAGRSLPWQLMLLFPGWGLAVALLAWMAVLHLRSADGDRRSLARSFLPSFAALTGFGVMVAAITTVPLPWEQVERLSETGRAVNDVPAAQRFVEQRTSPGEPILLFGTPTDHRLAERAGVTNVSPWNSAKSLFSERDVLRALDSLEQEEGSKVFLRQVHPLEKILLRDQGPVVELLRVHGFEQVVGDRNSRLALFERS